MAYESHAENANPFQSPSADPTHDFQPSGETAVILRRTRPWVLFMGVLGAILIGFMGLGMLGMLAAAGFGGQVGGIFLVMSVFYAVMIVGYVFPVIFLFKYAARIQAFAVAGTPELLDRALDAQRAVWKSIGIITLVFIVLYVFMMIAMVGFGGGGFVQPTPAQPALAPIP